MEICNLKTKMILISRVKIRYFGLKVFKTIMSVQKTHYLL